MRIAVISDTHIPKTAEWLPEKLCEELKNVDLILHAGDLTEIQVLERLARIAPTRAVYGNMDDAAVRKALPAKEIVKAGRFRIGLTHGSGPPFRMIGKVSTEFGKDVDAIVFGHTHSPKNEMRDGILFFNPGSPTDKIFAPFNSYGIIEINDGIKAEIIKL